MSHTAYFANPEKHINTMRNTAKALILLLLAITFGAQCLLAQECGQFVKVQDGQFIKQGKPYYFVGTNFWYGAILGSKGEGGDRKRLCQELDAMKRNGIDNLRILVGSDGECGVKTKVEPTLQVAPGKYNDDILDGLDFLLFQMKKRDMVAVLYLNNAWEWSGGYGFYLEHAGEGKAPIPAVEGYDKYMRFVSRYADNKKAHELFYNHVRYILGRTNRYTHTPYISDPTIMSWQIGNEPRAFSKEAIPGFISWLRESSRLIRSLDENHLISIGSEGMWGCENDYGVYERICQDENISYCNIHIWPYNWSWAKPDSLVENVGRAKALSGEYINRHVAICKRLKKPLVIEEFGYPRDNMRYEPNTPTRGRDEYYRYIFSLVRQDAKQKGVIAGCNFWGWGGFGKPKHEQWQKGDDYLGDPAQEAQGLNSVFITDKSTLRIVRQ